MPGARGPRRSTPRRAVTTLRDEPMSAVLLAAAQSGDPQALDRVLQMAQPDIRRYARRHCRNASDIDDALQETLILLYRRLGSLRAVGSFSYWLLRVVDRVCLRLGRRLLGVRTATDDLEDDVLAAHGDMSLRIDLVAAITSLPQHYRDVIVLRDVNELTVDEIARELSVTRQAVKARLHRARQLVREYILR